MDSDASPSVGFYNFLAWADLNKKRLLWGTGVLAVLALIITIVIQSSKRKELEANHALSELRLVHPPGKPLPPDAAAIYMKIAQDYAGTKAAARALVVGAGILFADGKYAEAQTQFERLLRQYPDSPWVSSAVLGVAAALEGQQKTNEATAKFEEFRRRFPNDPLSDEAKLSLARLYEGQNKNEEAFKLYEELTKANPYSGLGAEAGMRQVDLLQKYPHLAKTSAPPVAIFPPTVTSNPAVNMVTNKVMTTLSNIMQKAATNVASQTATNLAITNPAPLLLKPNAPASKP